MKKPVIEVTVETMWSYEYQAKHPISGEILASNSLFNLKREVRNRYWKMAWITTKNGCFSYGQSLVSEYPYKPR